MKVSITMDAPIQLQGRDRFSNIEILAECKVKEDHQPDVGIFNSQEITGLEFSYVKTGKYITSKKKYDYLEKLFDAKYKEELLGGL